MKQIFSPDEAAKILGLHKDTVLIWLKSGKLRGQKLGPKTWRVNEDDIVALMHPPDQPKSIDLVKVPTFVKKHFTPAQQELWTKLFKAFRSRDNFSTEIEIPQAHIDAIAHNCALTAIRELPDTIGRRRPKPAGKPRANRKPAGKVEGVQG